MKPESKGKDNMSHTFEHPAYGMISYSRVQGHIGNLAGSDLKHNHCIKLTIHESVKSRDLSHDKFYPKRGPLVEIYLSEHQWASFVASMGTTGVPCTFRQRPSKEAEIVSVPSLEEENKQDLFDSELKDRGDNISKGLKDASKELDDLLDQKTIKKSDVKSIKNLLDRALQDIDSNLKFHVDMHREAMEKNVQAAKSEIEGYITDQVSKLGLEKLEEIRPQLEDKKDD